MFKCYFGADEISEYYPGFVGVSKAVSMAVVAAILPTATKAVAQDLRRRGINTSRVYLPRMFDELDNFELVEKTANYISASIEPQGSETRFVAYRPAGLDYRACTFTVQGSQDDTIWIDLETVEADPTGLVTIDYSEKMPYIRYHLSTEGFVKYSPFIVDVAYDEMIRVKVILTALLPHLRPDGAFTVIYKELYEHYNFLLNKPVADMDMDGDGTIEAGETTRNRSYSMVR